MRRREEQMSARVTVVGAGIGGASVAFALARKGASVTIVDDAATGQATAAGAGIIAPWRSAAAGPFYEVSAAGAAFYPTLLEQLAELGITTTDYRRTGALSVHRDPAVLDEAEQQARSRVADAGPTAGQVQRLDSAQTRELFPVLAEDLEGLLITGGARVDGRTLRSALLAGARELGARSVRGRAVLGARQPTADTATPAAGAAGARSGSAAVHVDGEAIGADAVVLATGAWSNQLLEPLGLSVPVAPQRGQITHLRLEGVDTSRWPTVHPMSHHYLVAFDEGRIVAGATRETGSGFDPRITAAGQAQVLADALGIAPGLARATLIETRVGLRPLPDQLPVVGAVPGQENLYIATGYGAVGLTVAPLIGDALARAIVGEPAPELAALGAGESAL